MMVREKKKLYLRQKRQVFKRRSGTSRIVRKSCKQTDRFRPEPESDLALNWPEKEKTKSISLVKFLFPKTNLIFGQPSVSH